jgi:hypothetical protein
MANPCTKLSKIQFLPVRPVEKVSLWESTPGVFFFFLNLTYNNMSLLPDKTKKIQQENFRTYRDLRDWMSNNGFKNKGYVLEEPWRDLFVERWEKNNLIALSLDLTFLPDFTKIPLLLLQKPYQIDIAQVD